MMPKYNIDLKISRGELRCLIGVYADRIKDLLYNSEPKAELDHNAERMSELLSLLCKAEPDAR
jgi:hypothetical protein